MDANTWRQLVDLHEELKHEDELVNEPSHYTKYAIEPKNFIIRNDMEFWRGNIIKYASRAGSKMYPDKDARESEIVDLKKAIRYAQMRINQLNGEMDI